MKSLQDTFKLSNGVEIPCVGFGTFRTPDGEVAVRAVKEAIAAGYRHIDTAAVYGNERSVGAAVRESGIDRKDIFITSKLWNSDQGFDSTLRAVREEGCIGVASIRLLIPHLDAGGIRAICSGSGDWDRVFSLVYHKNKYMTEAMEAFIATARGIKDAPLPDRARMARLVA